LLLAATRGDAGSQTVLGLFYARAQDYDEARIWFEKAAAQGYPPAYYALGVMYDNGNGVTQNYSEAAKWYRLAADQQVVLAQSRLGRMYGAGQGVVQDYREAVRWLKPAAEGGDAQAQGNLGTLYGLGFGGLAHDLIEAHKWLNLAAARAPDSQHQKDWASVRDKLLEFMSRREIAEAQKRAREWQEAFESSHK
jgi:TPR repeat protein